MRSLCSTRKVAGHFDCPPLGCVPRRVSAWAAAALRAGEPSDTYGLTRKPMWRWPRVNVRTRHVGPVIASLQEHLELAHRLATGDPGIGQQRDAVPAPRDPEAADPVVVQDLEVARADAPRRRLGGRRRVGVGVRSDAESDAAAPARPEGARGVVCDPRTREPAVPVLEELGEQARGLRAAHRRATTRPMSVLLIRVIPLLLIGSPCCTDLGLTRVRQPPRSLLLWRSLR